MLEKNKTLKTNKTAWVPRILSILFILFLTMFSFDVFDSVLNIWQAIVAFLIHNIPSIVLLITLLVSWKREIVGAVVFFLAGLSYIVLVVANKNFDASFLTVLLISGPAFIVSILYFINWKRRRSGLKNV